MRWQRVLTEHLDLLCAHSLLVVVFGMPARVFEWCDRSAMSRCLHRSSTVLPGESRSAFVPFSSSRLNCPIQCLSTLWG